MANWFLQVFGSIFLKLFYILSVDGTVNGPHFLTPLSRKHLRTSQFSCPTDRRRANRSQSDNCRCVGKHGVVVVIREPIVSQAPFNRCLQ